MIVPTILENTIEEIISKVQIAQGRAQRIQIDLHDGKFAHTTTFLSVPELEKLETTTALELDIQTANPSAFFPKSRDKIKYLVLHVESEGFSRSLLEDVQAGGFYTGLSLDPQTSLDDIEPFLEFADCVQFMTVNPGPQGQEFIPEVLNKIREFKKAYPLMDVSVDGGINDQTARLTKDAGASIFVCGSFLFSGNFESNFSALERAIS